MIRRLLPLALAALAGCASSGTGMRASGYYGESQTVASNDCRVGELGWWEGRLNRCSWYPFAENASDD